MYDDLSRQAASDPLSATAGRMALLSSLCAMLMHKSYGKDSFDTVIEEAITMIESDKLGPGRFHSPGAFQFHEMPAPCS